LKAAQQNISYGVFEWESNSIRDKQTINSTNIIIVEGVGLLRPELMNYFSYTIWIDCPIDVAMERGKKRDREEHGQPHDELWDGLWRENDIEYEKNFKPKSIVNIVMNYRDVSQFS
jgi:uridine kinase